MSQLRQSSRVKKLPAHLQDCVMDLDVSGRGDVALVTEKDLVTEPAAMADSKSQSQESSLLVIPDADQTLTPTIANRTVSQIDDRADGGYTEPQNTQELLDMIDRNLDIGSAEPPNTQELFDMIDRNLNDSAEETSPNKTQQKPSDGGRRVPATSTPRTPGSIARNACQSLHKKVDIVQKQLDSIEAHVGLIPELQLLITRQKKCDDMMEEILKMQNKIKKLEKELREAEMNTKTPEEKLTEAYNVNGHMKNDLDSWRQRATDAETELKNSKNSIQKENTKSTKDKTSSNKQSPVEENFPMSEDNRTESKRSLTENSATPPEKPRDIVYVRSPHVLSVMEERAPFRYRGREYRYAEVAYQTEKVAHTLGENSHHLKEIMKLSGLESKAYVKDLPYSKSWQSCKERVMEDICSSLEKQDSTFSEALLATGSLPIKHPVPDKFWGTTHQGQNKYGKILMRICARIGEKDSNSDLDVLASGDNEGFKAVIEQGTEGLVIADSQCKFINERLMFGRAKVAKIKCSTTQALKSFVDDMGNGGIRHKIKHVLVNVGINNIRDKQRLGDICSSLEDALQALKASCPHARIYYSAPLKRHPSTELETLRFHMEEFCHRDNISFIQHNIYRHL